jgi:hypothetical protein
LPPAQSHLPWLSGSRGDRRGTGQTVYKTGHPRQIENQAKFVFDSQIVGQSDNSDASAVADSFI